MTRRKDFGQGGNGGRFTSRHRPKADDTVSLSAPVPAARTTQALHDFVLFSEMAERLVARGREAYESDELLRLAAEAIVHRVGESVARLDQDVIDEHPTIPWRRIKGMRNRIAHEYHSTDSDLLWEVMERYLPTAADEVRRILRERDLD